MGWLLVEMADKAVLASATVDKHLPSGIALDPSNSDGELTDGSHIWFIHQAR